MKKSKAVQLIITVVLFLVVVLVIGLGFSYKTSISKIEGELEVLQLKIAEIKQEIGEKKGVYDLKKTQVVIEATGLDPRLVEKDAKQAEIFFEDAFTWTNGDEYDEVRQKYIDVLGEGNEFTKTYLPEAIKIDTNDGPLSQIDVNNMNAYYESVDVVPLVAEDKRIRYVGFVKYYMVKDKKDLAKKSALDPSEAIIWFTVSGDDDLREVSEVTAWPGFSASVKD